VTVTSESSKNGAIALYRMLTTAYCLALGLGSELDLVTSWLVVIHTY